MTTSRQKAIGSAAERAIAKQLDGIRVGMDGGPVDVVVGDYLAIQVKALSSLPSMREVDHLLRLVPRDPRLRAVVIIERAGRGSRGVRTITFDLDEWAEWHA